MNLCGSTSLIRDLKGENVSIGIFSVLAHNSDILRGSKWLRFVSSFDVLTREDD